MDPQLRSRFNADFTSDQYAALVRCVNETEKWPADFRISETPIFLTHEFTDEVTRAANEIVDLTRRPEFAHDAASAVPKVLEVPNESAHPNFLVVDFGICSHGNRLVPRLIELQAFPSLFGFQLLLLHCMRKAYPAIPRNWTSSFGGIKDEAYLELLRRTIIADSAPENVILLEIEPEKQKTRVDFAATETLLGIRSVSVTEIKKRGRQLFCDRDGHEARIVRIYNRVIFDELIRRRDLNLEAYSESLYPERLGWSPLRALRDRQFKLIVAPRPELYDLFDDPFETKNIYDDRRALAERMTARTVAIAKGRGSAPDSRA